MVIFKKPAVRFYALLMLLFFTWGTMECPALAHGKFKPDSPIDYQVEKVIFKILKNNELGSEAPTIEDMRTLLDFMMTSTGRGADVNPEKYAGGAGVFWRDSFDKPLRSVLEYLYNPKITQEVLYPASINFNRIQPESGIFKLDKPIWEYLDGLEEPVVFWTREWEEITPDTNSGTYYNYKLDRLNMLFNYRDLPMVMTISWQDGESEFGKKGGVLGPYQNWDFVYSPEQGATASGIGWAKTYMYSSATITLLYPEGEKGLSTGYSMFKWLKAGWSGFNVVQTKHIIEGADRNFAGINDVIGRENSPSPQELEKMVAGVLAADDATLVAKCQAYCLELEKNAASDEILSREEFQKVLAGGKYAQTLSRERLEALAAKIELKRLLGRPVLGG